MWLSKFLVTKNCFNILEQPPWYPLSVQAYILPALCALHNFIQQHDPNDLILDLEKDKDKEEEEGVEVKDEEIDLTQFGDLGLGIITCQMQERAAETWDIIASQMWKDYNAFLV